MPSDTPSERRSDRSGRRSERRTESRRQERGTRGASPRRPRAQPPSQQGQSTAQPPSQQGFQRGAPAGQQPPAGQPPQAGPQQQPPKMGPQQGFQPQQAGQPPQMGPRPQRAGGQPPQQEFQPQSQRQQAQPQQFDPEFAGSQSIRSGQWGQSGQTATTGGMAQQGPTAGFAGSQQLVSQPPALYPEQFSDHLTEELRVCLDDCIDVGQVAAWSADKCAARGSEQAACAKLCNEVSTLGTVVAEFIARDARSVAPVIEAYVETAELALAELERFDEPHTEETAMVVDRSVESALEALDRN